MGGGSGCPEIAPTFFCAPPRASLATSGGLTAAMPGIVVTDAFCPFFFASQSWALLVHAWGYQSARHPQLDVTRIFAKYRETSSSGMSDLGCQVGSS